MSQAQRDLLPSLIQIAETNLPQLKFEIENNGSSIFKLQAAVAELHTIISYAIHHMIDERRRILSLAATAAGAVPAASPTPAPTQAPRAPAPPPYVQRPTLPPLERAAPIGPATAPSPGPGPTATQGTVLDVTITPQGTRVTHPGAAAPMIVPPGAHVDTTFLTEKQIPEGVVLAPGGEMSPEVAAAMGVARNITADPV